jgi:hypothetical protein
MCKWDHPWHAALMHPRFRSSPSLVVAGTTGTADRTRPRCLIQLNRCSTSRPVHAVHIPGEGQKVKGGSGDVVPTTAASISTAWALIVAMTP